jgi:hypothetical protein
VNATALFERDYCPLVLAPPNGLKSSQKAKPVHQCNHWTSDLIEAAGAFLVRERYAPRPESWRP